jgi:hypothetical protein
VALVDELVDFEYGILLFVHIFDESFDEGAEFLPC